jgi:IK cytokine
LERKTAEEQGIAPIFRDRAKERRDGANPDYEAVNNEAVTAIAAQHDPSLAKAEPEEVLSKVSISESKYLGGDMEHTHLVKGLDFALLEKIRAEIAAKQEEELKCDATPWDITSRGIPRCVHYHASRDALSRGVKCVG